jgi:hypothetical protein
MLQKEVFLSMVAVIFSFSVFFMLHNEQSSAEIVSIMNFFPIYLVENWQKNHCPKTKNSVEIW